MFSLEFVVDDVDFGADKNCDVVEENGGYS